MIDDLISKLVQALRDVYTDAVIQIHSMWGKPIMHLAGYALDDLGTGS